MNCHKGLYQCPMEYSFSLKYSSYVNEFSKVTGYKINIWKSLAFLFTNNKKSERELKKTISFTTSTKRIKYLGINLPVKRQKTCMQKTIRHWWKIPKTKQAERYITFLYWKNQYCKNDSTTHNNLQINTIPVKLPVAIFTELEQKISQFVRKHNSQNNLEKQKQSWRNQPSWL